jgi:hypothetical protein
VCLPNRSQKIAIHKDISLRAKSVAKVSTHCLLSGMKRNPHASKVSISSHAHFFKKDNALFYLATKILSKECDFFGSTSSLNKATIQGHLVSTPGIGIKFSLIQAIAPASKR